MSKTSKITKWMKENNVSGIIENDKIRAMGNVILKNVGDRFPSFIKFKTVNGHMDISESGLKYGLGMPQVVTGNLKMNIEQRKHKSFSGITVVGYLFS